MKEDGLTYFNFDLNTNLRSDLNSGVRSDLTSDVMTNLSELSWDLKSDLQAGGLNLLALLGLGFNGFVFLMYYNRRNIRSYSNRFVLSLATSHILQCVAVIPLFIVSLKSWVSGEIWCKVSSSLTLCINLASVLSVLLIAVDRNCAVNAPLHYNLNASKERTSFLIGSIWISSVVLSLPVLFGIPELDYNTCDIKSSSLDNLNIGDLVYISIITFIGFAVPLISLGCLYFAMFRAAVNNNSRALKNNCKCNDVIVKIKTSKNFGENEYCLRRNYSNENAEPKRKYCRFVDKHKAAVTGLLVVISFIVCWSPYFIVRLCQPFYGVTLQIKFWINFSSFLSCILNPYVYFYRNKSTWKLTKKLASRIFRRRKDFIVQPVVRKAKIDTSNCVFRLPVSFSQTVLSTQVPVEKHLTSHSMPDERSLSQTAFREDLAGLKTSGIFSVEPVKILLHQDSSSSNDSSDAYVTTLSLEADTTVRYQSFHDKLNEETMIEIPLHDIITK